MELFKLLTPISYWLLIIIWSFILWFYFRYLRSSIAYNKTLHVLLVILAIDAFRTLFESSYFGIFFTAQMGMIPRSLAEFLIQPHLVIIPKLINLVAAILVLSLLLRKLLPSIYAEQREQKQYLDSFEQELKDRQAEDDQLLLMQQALDGTNQIILFVNSAAEMNYVNEYGVSKTGYSKEEFASLRLLDLIPEMTLSRFQALIDEPTTETGKCMKARVIRKDGTAFDGVVRLSISQSAGQGVSYVYITSQEP